MYISVMRVGKKGPGNFYIYSHKKTKILLEFHFGSIWLVSSRIIFFNQLDTDPIYMINLKFKYNKIIIILYIRF